MIETFSLDMNRRRNQDVKRHHTQALIAKAILAQSSSKFETKNEMSRLEGPNNPGNGRSPINDLSLL